MLKWKTIEWRSSRPFYQVGKCSLMEAILMADQILQNVHLEGIKNGWLMMFDPRSIFSLKGDETWSDVMGLKLFDFASETSELISIDIRWFCEIHFELIDWHEPEKLLFSFCARFVRIHAVFKPDMTLVFKKLCYSDSFNWFRTLMTHDNIDNSSIELYPDNRN